MNPTIYNDTLDETVKQYRKVDPNSSTVSQFVDSFNNNADAGQQFIGYLRQTLANGVYWVPEFHTTIGGVEIQSLYNLAQDFVNISPNNLEIDNLYMYFRNLNQIILLDEKTFDLSAYADGKMHLFYINSELGFRVSELFDQSNDEICLFRFIITEENQFLQLHTTFQRFGTSVYDAYLEYYSITGLTPRYISQPSKAVKLSEGYIKRSGLRFDVEDAPDGYILNEDTQLSMRYIDANNTINYVLPTTTQVIANKILDYTNHTLANIQDDKFTIQRILFDIYNYTLVFQYGDVAFDSLSDALSNVYSIKYPFPYDVLMCPVVIPIGLLVIKSNYTDLTDGSQAVFIQNVVETISDQASSQFAEDPYARSRINVMEDTLNSLSTTVSTHINNTFNPHSVTKAQVGLSNVDNYSYNTIKSNIKTDLSNNWIKKNTNDTTTGKLTINGGVEVPSTATVDNKAQSIKVNGHRVYVGVNPNSISGASTGDYAIYFE